MSKQDNNFFDEMNKLAGSAFSMAAGMKHETEEVIKSHFESWIESMDLVKREEFEIAKEMAAKALGNQEKLEKRIETLEKVLKDK
jgi:BMFP domain-containing protein YqiC